MSAERSAVLAAAVRKHSANWWHAARIGFSPNEVAASSTPERPVLDFVVLLRGYSSIPRDTTLRGYSCGIRGVERTSCLSDARHFFCGYTVAGGFAALSSPRKSSSCSGRPSFSISDPRSSSLDSLRGVTSGKGGKRLDEIQRPGPPRVEQRAGVRCEPEPKPPPLSCLYSRRLA